MFSISSSLQYLVPQWRRRSADLWAFLHSKRKFAIVSCGTSSSSSSSSMNEDSDSMQKQNQLDFDPSRDLFGLEVDLHQRNNVSDRPKPRSWFGPNGQYIRELPCPSCRGRGYTPCTECGFERSRLDCSQCSGKGLMTCRQCLGDCVIWEESIDELPWEKARSRSPLKVKEDDEVDKLDIKLDARRKSKRVYQSPPPEVGLKISRSLRVCVQCAHPSDMDLYYVALLLGLSVSMTWPKTIKSIFRLLGYHQLERPVMFLACGLCKSNLARVACSDALCLNAYGHSLNARTGLFSKLMKIIHRNPELHAQRVAAIKKAKGTAAARKQASEAMKAFFSDPENRLKRSISMKGLKFHCSHCKQEGHRRFYCPELRNSLGGGYKFRCRLCRERGHNRRTCHKLRASDSAKREEPRSQCCSICGQRGHNCRTCSHGAGKKRGDSSSGKGSQTPRGGTYSCSLCLAKGHNIRTCSNRKTHD